MMDTHFKCLQEDLKFNEKNANDSKASTEAHVAIGRGSSETQF